MNCNQSVLRVMKIPTTNLNPNYIRARTLDWDCLVVTIGPRCFVSREAVGARR